MCFLLAVQPSEREREIQLGRGDGRWAIDMHDTKGQVCGFSIKFAVMKWNG